MKRRVSEQASAANHRLTSALPTRLDTAFGRKRSLPAWRTGDNRAAEEKIHASEQGTHLSDTAIRTFDDNSCHRAGLCAAELRQRGWFMVGWRLDDDEGWAARAGPVQSRLRR